MRLPSPPPADLAALKQRDVLVDGHRIAYTEAGEGPPVLLLHGAVFAGNPFWWSTQAALAPRFRTFAPDFPGWGASEKPRGRYEVEFYHQFLAGFIDALGLERPAVVGHSLGGLIGSSFAVHHPERVAALATVAVPPAWVSIEMPQMFQRFLVPGLGEAMLALAPLFGPDNTTFGVRKTMEGLFHEPLKHREALRGPIAACCDTLADPNHPYAFLDTFRRNEARLGEHARNHALLSETQFPTLVMACAQDPLFPLPLVTRGAELHPRAKFDVIDACGHFPMWEQPEAFQASLLGFLDEVFYNNRSTP